MESEIVCPFCQARRPLMATAEQPLPFERYDDYLLYRCPCGAVASLSTPIPDHGWPLDAGEAALCRAILHAKRSACHVRLNYTTGPGTPESLLWAKRRSVPAQPPREEAKP